MNLSVLVLIGVLALIAARKVGHIRVAIWQAMVAGALIVLAAGSTIAGNLLILGAASNVIIVQRAERHGANLGFMEFACAGIPLTLLQAVVYWLFLCG